jgi:hypothetical protein
MLRLIPSQSRGIFAVSHDSTEPRQDDAIGNLIRENQDANGAADTPAEPRERPENTAQGSSAKKAEKGYGASDRRALDNLLQSGGGKR